MNKVKAQWAAKTICKISKRDILNKCSLQNLKYMLHETEITPQLPVKIWVITHSIPIHQSEYQYKGKAPLKSPVESARHRHLKSIKKKLDMLRRNSRKTGPSSEQGAPLVVAVLLRYQPLPFTPCYHFAVITEISHQVALLGFITSQFFNHSRRLPSGGCLRLPPFWRPLEPIRIASCESIRGHLTTTMGQPWERGEGPPQSGLSGMAAERSRGFVNQKLLNHWQLALGENRTFHSRTHNNFCKCKNII